jgi:hypothetical protein
MLSFLYKTKTCVDGIMYDGDRARRSCKHPLQYFAQTLLHSCHAAYYCLDDRCKDECMIAVTEVEEW